MARYVVPIVIACVYVAGAAWLVRNEGRSYRDSLRPATAEPAPPPVASNSGRRHRETGGARPGTGESSARSSGGDADNHRGSPSRTGEQAHGDGPDRPAHRSTDTGRNSRREGGATGRRGRGRPVSQWRNDPFWSQPDLVKSWDLDHLTLQDEKQLGAQLNSLILQLNPEDPGSGLRRVREAAGRLRGVIDSKEREYKFFVLNSEVANAFSHPGGYVYISRKLLEMLPEDEPAPLEFILAHESRTSSVTMPWRV